MFHDEKAVQPFIALYKDIENLNKQMQQIKTKNQKIVEEAL
jgi:cell division protein FtsB